MKQADPMRRLKQREQSPGLTLHFEDVSPGVGWSLLFFPERFLHTDGFQEPTLSAIKFFIRLRLAEPLFLKYAARGQMFYGLHFYLISSFCFFVI